MHDWYLLATFWNPVTLAFAPATVSFSFSFSALWSMPVTLEEGRKHCDFQLCMLHSLFSVLHCLFMFIHCLRDKTLYHCLHLCFGAGPVHCNIEYSNYPFKYSDISSLDKFLIFIVSYC